MEPSSRFYPVVNDFRDPYARDRDRVIHASSFRRLEYKTQVFINHEGDYFRTRLTHSLEVSQIARTICKNLQLNDSLAEAIALSHDLGHTPFGHVGGDELDAVLKSRGCESGFDHNFQSFRVVTRLEKRYREFDGLNLTFATLEGVLKHSYPYRKPFLNPWYDEVFGLDFHPSLEACVVDRADEIAYISHDIDDGIKYGLIAFEELAQSELVGDIMRIVGKEGVTQRDRVFRYRFISHLINALVYDLIDHSKAILPKTDTILCKTIPAVEPVPLGFSKETENRIKKLKKILFEKLYRHELIMKRMYSGRICIRNLFEALMDEPRLLPKEYRVRLGDEKPCRVVADFIAGMSDRYALKFYQELYGQSL